MSVRRCKWRAVDNVNIFRLDQVCWLAKGRGVVWTLTVFYNWRFRVIHLKCLSQTGLGCRLTCDFIPLWLLQLHHDGETVWRHRVAHSVLMAHLTETSSSGKKQTIHSQSSVNPYVHNMKAQVRNSLSATDWIPAWESPHSHVWGEECTPPPCWIHLLSLSVAMIGCQRYKYWVRPNRSKEALILDTHSMFNTKHSTFNTHVY